jgi:hypothetical protein
MSPYSRYTFLSMALLIAALSACSKKPAEETAETPTAEVATENTAPAADPSQEDADKQAAKEELAKKQAQLDYATMEDTYINDPKAQWASSAKASSTFGEEQESSSDVNKATNVIGKTDGKTWSNNNQEIGFDWVEVGFEKPVHATEVRFVLPDQNAAKSVSKVELIEANGTKHEVWSGVSDIEPDSRGNRTWFVKQFEATPYQVVGAKLSFANNMASGYKEVDAAQIVGE